MSPPQDLKTEAALRSKSPPCRRPSRLTDSERGRRQGSTGQKPSYLLRPAWGDDADDARQKRPSLAGSTGPFSKPCAGSEILSSSQSTFLANCIYVVYLARTIFDVDACWRLKVAGEFMSKPP
ncbi:hypothetical protein E4U58_000714 [Claviceps cyperi]|nr:hypothetical protein E4U58_000714 [Claviceps cyperi]